MQDYQIIIRSKDGKPIPPPVRSWLGLSPGTSAREEIPARSHTELRRLLDRLRHPLLVRAFRLANTAGEPVGPVIHPVECAGGWLRYDIKDSPFFVYEKNNGKTRFEVLEKGAGPRGTARPRGTAPSLPAALETAASLDPSTPAEILAQTPVCGEDGKRDRVRLERLAEPGTRLWLLPARKGDGFTGLGQPATSLGLALNSVEAIFGPAGDNCWLIRVRADDGAEDALRALRVLTLEEVAERWWVTDGHGNLLTGGHPDRGRMEKLAAEHGGYCQQGLAQGDEAARRMHSPRQEHAQTESIGLMPEY